MSERIVSGSKQAALEMHFYARKVFLVMGNTSGQTIQVKVTLNGKDVTTEGGKDVTASVISVNRHTLYDVLELKEATEGNLRLTASAPGLELYAFTFGG